MRPMMLIRLALLLALTIGGGACTFGPGVPPSPEVRAEQEAQAAGDVLSAEEAMEPEAQPDEQGWVPYQ